MLALSDIEQSKYDNIKYIDYLPYIDHPISESNQQQINQLIMTELSNMPRPECIASSEQSINPRVEHRLQQLLARQNDSVKQDDDIFNQLMNSEYMNESIEQQQCILNQIHILRQHMNNHRINIELGLQHGTNQWREYLQDVGNTRDRMEQINNTLQYQINGINAQRKYEQIQVDEQVQRIEGEKQILRDKIQMIVDECQKQEQEIRDIVVKKLKIQ